MAILAVASAALALSATPSTPATGTGALLAPSTVCRGQRAVAAPPAVQHRALRCLVNWTRRHAGLAPVQTRPELERSAAMRANDIRRCNNFSHTPCGQAFLTVFTLAGYFTGAASVKAPALFGRANVTVWVAQFGRRPALSVLP